jgi:DNA helicase-2/ATP-dependent DNA helicase PcrA
MTLHSAKGLEFDDVFVTGLEEGMLPHRNCRDDASVQEERRLFYVGITRAKQRAWITHATTRFMHGNVDFTTPSRFLQELPSDELREMDYGDSLSTEFGSGWVSGKKKVAAWEDDDNFVVLDDDDGFAADAFGDVDADIDPNPDFLPDGDAGFADDFAGVAPVQKKWPKREWPGAKPKPAAKSSKFRAGDLVRHPSFGSGKVLTVDKRKIMVQFFASGTRLLHEDLSQLTKE